MSWQLIAVALFLFICVMFLMRQLIDYAERRQIKKRHGRFLDNNERKR